MSELTWKTSLCRFPLGQARKPLSPPHQCSTPTQYPKGAIRSSVELFTRPNVPDFQYLKGAIRSTSAARGASSAASFQYLKGAIRRSPYWLSRLYRIAFQYLKGAIRSRFARRGGARENRESFNTSKVRLGEGEPVTADGHEGGFQYLKGAIRRYTGQRGPWWTIDFQYLKGAIRSWPGPRRPHGRRSLSIPQRCD